jgi:hypothetical protein
VEYGTIEHMPNKNQQTQRGEFDKISQEQSKSEQHVQNWSLAEDHLKADPAATVDVISVDIDLEIRELGDRFKRLLEVRKLEKGGSRIFNIPRTRMGPKGVKDVEIDGLTKRFDQHAEHIVAVADKAFSRTNDERFNWKIAAAKFNLAIPGRKNFNQRFNQLIQEYKDSGEQLKNWKHARNNPSSRPEDLITQDKLRIELGKSKDFENKLSEIKEALLNHNRDINYPKTLTDPNVELDNALGFARFEQPPKDVITKMEKDDLRIHRENLQLFGRESQLEVNEAMFGALLTFSSLQPPEYGNVVGQPGSSTESVESAAGRMRAGLSIDRGETPVSAIKM